MAMEKLEFEFPHEKEGKTTEVEFEIEGDEPEEQKVEAKKPDVAIEVVDDTPPKDRDRKPMKRPPEEVTEEELSEYSEKVQTRLKHFSRGYHDERRAKEAALREREEAIRLAQKVMEDNKTMTDKLRKLEEDEIRRAKLVAQIKVKQAHEAGDSEALASANAELTKAVVREERFSTENVKTEEQETLQSEKTVVASQPLTAPAPDPRAVQWQDDNPWFGTDDEMTVFALGLHQKLIKSGVDPRSDDYYDRINRRMREVFPEQFAESEPEPEPKPEAKPKKASVVAPATRSVAPKKVVLTKSQVALAKRLGVPLELYAQKVAEEMRK